MFGRPFVLASMLAASVGLPYLSSNATQSLESSDGLFGLFGNSKTPQSAGALPGGPGETNFSPNPATLAERAAQPELAAPLEGFQVHDLGNVLRFDVTPQWVYDHWSRKTTALPELDLYGVRVPLVTGTRETDLAGSLTYYFNHLGQVERINFVGRTGDPSQLISLLKGKFYFHRQVPKLPGEQLYEVRWNGRPTSQLLVRPAPVIWATAAHATFKVELEMNRPGSLRYVQSPAPAKIPMPRAGQP